MPAAIETHPVQFIQRARPTARPASNPAEWPVALVCMPFVSVYRPSLQICLLKSLAEQHGFHARTLHLNLDFARQIGVSLYERLVRHRGRMFGDWLFSQQAFGDDAPAQGRHMLDAFPQETEDFLRDLGLSKVDLHRIRDEEVPRYLDHLIAAIDWSAFRVIGFTSTFQQNAASFALARRLKRRHPQLQTIFGGANFDGEMGEELTRRIDCIDYAAIGEADVAWQEFLQALAEQRDPATVPGIIARRNGNITLRTRARRWRISTPARCPTTRNISTASNAWARWRRRPNTWPTCPSKPARPLVGAKTPLHLLRPERHHHALPRQVAGAR
jgi:hypothetical protein